MEVHIYLKTHLHCLISTFTETVIQIVKGEYASILRSLIFLS